MGTNILWIMLCNEPFLKFQTGGVGKVVILGKNQNYCPLSVTMKKIMLGTNMSNHFSEASHMRYGSSSGGLHY